MSFDHRKHFYRASTAGSLKCLAFCAESNWDGCEIVRDFFYDRQAGFNAQTAADKILARLGPVVLIEKVQTLPHIQLCTDWETEL